MFSSNCLRNAEIPPWLAVQHGPAGQAGVSPVPAVPQPDDLATGSPVSNVAVAEAVAQPESLEAVSAEAVVVQLNLQQRSKRWRTIALTEDDDGLPAYMME